MNPKSVSLYDSDTILDGELRALTQPVTTKQVVPGDKADECPASAKKQL